MKLKKFGFAALTFWIVSVIRLVLMIVTMAKSGLINSPGQAVASVTEPGLLFYVFKESGKKITAISLTKLDIRKPPHI